MPASDSQTFLRELDKKLAARDRLVPRAGRRVRAGARINCGTAADSRSAGEAAEGNVRSNLDAAIPSQHAGTRSGGLRTASSSFLRLPNRSSPLLENFTSDKHPDLRADFVMALPRAPARSLPRSLSADRPNERINPPFNNKERWGGKLEGDARWSRSEAESASHDQFRLYRIRGKYDTPPDGNANFAWGQHMLHYLAPNGSMALLVANGSMTSKSSGEGDIRRALLEVDLVACMATIPKNSDMRQNCEKSYSFSLQ